MAKEECKILVVDDDPDMLNLYKVAFQSKLLKLTAIDNGKEALEVLAEKQFDLVILDIAMEQPNGIEILRWIRANVKEQKLLVCSSFSSVAFEELRNEQFLKKPFQVKSMLRQVKSILFAEKESS